MFKYLYKRYIKIIILKNKNINRNKKKEDVDVQLLTQFHIKESRQYTKKV